MRLLIALAAIAAVLAGCGSPEPEATPAGTREEAPIKGGQGGAQGMSPNDLTVPGN